MFYDFDFEKAKEQLFKAEERLIDGEEIEEIEEYLINKICAINSRFSKHGAIEEFFNALNLLIEFIKEKK